jgi:YggT family protein
MLYAFIIALRAVINVMEVLLVIRVFCEFKLLRRNSGPFQFLLLITEPLLNPVRKMLSKANKDKPLRFDISPLFVIILLYLINSLLKRYV